MNKRYNIAMFLLRIAAGIIFIAHGLPKIQNPQGFVEFFQRLRLPEFMIYVVGYVEVIGGVLLIIGLWTSIVATVLAVLIAVAMFYAKGGAVFRTFNVQVFEIDLALLAITVALALKGSGRIAARPSHGLCSDCDCGKTCEIK